MNKRTRKQRRSSLRRGKVKGLGFFEGIKLRIMGRMDGKTGLPKMTADGSWTSPHINRECNSFEEFSCRRWGELQMEAEAAYARLKELVDDTAHKYQQLAEATEVLAQALEAENALPIRRREGEENLTDLQVKNRRLAESAKRLAPLKARIASLEAAIDADRVEGSAIVGRVTEDENTTHMICDRVGDHTLQRIDVYWNSAMRKHPSGESMPALPGVELTRQAEREYTVAHDRLMEQVKMLLDPMAGECDEKEAA